MKMAKFQKQIPPMQHSGPPSLRPLKAGEILDRAFRLYRANFWLFTGTASVLLMPILILRLANLYVFPYFYTNYLSFFTFLAGEFLKLCFLPGLMIWAASCAYLNLPISINAAYRKSLHCFGPLLAASVRQGFVYLPAIVVWAAVGEIVLFATKTHDLPNNVATGCLITLSLLVGLYILFFLTRLWLAYPVIVFEKLAAADALKRSWLLTSKNFWHVLLVLFASSLFVYLMLWLPERLISLNAMAHYLHIDSHGRDALSLVVEILVLIINAPLFYSTLVILYFDMRIRREGYDLQLALGLADEDGEISPVSA